MYWNNWTLYWKNLPASEEASNIHRGRRSLINVKSIAGGYGQCFLNVAQKLHKLEINIDKVKFIK